MPISHDHHVVPQFYLRGFADGQRRIRQLSRTHRTGRLVAVKRATVAADFYNVRDAEGTEHDGWEQVLGYIETRAAPVAQKIVHGVWPLPDNEREMLANWIAAQYLRTPAFRFVLDQNLDEWRDGIDRRGLDAIRSAVDRSGLSDDAARGLWERGNQLYPRGAYQSTNTQLRWFAALLPDTAKALYERAWTLVRFPEPALLTADNAVVPVEVGDDLHPLATAARVVLVALDRQHLLQLVAAAQHQDRTVTGTSEMAFMANAMAVHNADRFVFQHPADDLANLVWDIPE